MDKATSNDNARSDEPIGVPYTQSLQLKPSPIPNNQHIISYVVILLITLSIFYRLLRNLFTCFKIKVLGIEKD